MEFGKAFWISLVVMLVLFTLPTIRTYGAPASDGQRVYGFPFTYQSSGGRCVDGPCGFFSWGYLALDLLILLAVPFSAAYLTSKRIA